MTTSTPFPTLSQVASGPQDTIIRDLLKLANQPEIISFAGGLPSPAGFPVQAVKEAAEWVMDTVGRQALQYSYTEGEVELRRVIAERETQRGVPTSFDEVLIVSGSQQALDLVARTFVDPGSKILVESPTYMGALQAFRLSQPTFTELKTDRQGLNPLWIGEEARGARFAYIMPTFANPSGLTIDETRRQQLADKAREYDFWIVEDDPYGELFYEKEPPKSLRAFAPERTIRLGTLSKVLAPGFRLGYIVAPKAVLNVFSLMKQAIDLHTATFTQKVAARVFEEGLMKTHLPAVREIYRTQCHVMLDALKTYMPQREDLYWSEPTGGMFIWLTLPKHMDASKLMARAIEKKVAFVPGQAFYANEAEPWHLRLSFVTVPPEKIREGIKALAEVIAEAM